MIYNLAAASRCAPAIADRQLSSYGDQICP